MVAWSRGPGEASLPPPWMATLSKREVEVLRLLARGADNKEIASRLFIAEQTVKNHVSLIYEKLRARDRTQAMRMAIDARIDVKAGPA